jgi:hypothetical protein
MQGAHSVFNLSLRVARNVCIKQQCECEREREREREIHRNVFKTKKYRSVTVLASRRHGLFHCPHKKDLKIALVSSIDLAFPHFRIEKRGNVWPMSSLGSEDGDCAALQGQVGFMI